MRSNRGNTGNTMVYDTIVSGSRSMAKKFFHAHASTELSVFRPIVEVRISEGGNITEVR